MNQPASYPLRLPQSLKEVVAEKLAVIDTVRFYEERKGRADMARFRQILNRSGGEPPRPDDELPE